MRRATASEGQRSRLFLSRTGLTPKYEPVPERRFLIVCGLTFKPAANSFVVISADGLGASCI
jgi:hypothetical protein